MVRPTKQQVHCRRSPTPIPLDELKQKQDNFYRALNFVFSIIACGLHYKKTFICFLLNGIIPPKHNYFYKLQRIVVQVLCDMAVESMNKEAAKIRQTDVLAVDGAWNHRRNGTECNAVIINTRTDKVVYLQTVTKPHGRVVGNFDGAAPNMESEAVKRAMPFLHQLDFAGYVHDKDNKTRKIFSENFADLEEHLDPNHVKKSIQRKFENFNQNNELRGLETRLVSYFQTLIKQDITPEEMKVRWLNAEQHFCGNHQNCHHGNCRCYHWNNANNDQARDSLHNFLEATAPNITKVGYQYQTNSNESFNSLVTNYADKSTAWESSYRGRLSAAVLQKNDPYLWIPEARKRLNLPPLDDDCNALLNQCFQSSMKNDEKRRSPEYKLEKNLSRSNKINHDSNSTREKYDYKPYNHQH